MMIWKYKEEGEEEEASQQDNEAQPIDDAGEEEDEPADSEGEGEGDGDEDQEQDPESRMKSRHAKEISKTRKSNFSLHIGRKH